MTEAAHTSKQIRGARLQHAVLDATITRIEEVGIGDVRISDIASMAGVHETSIYRRWKTLPRLLVEALIARIGTEIPIPDTGSVQTDLESFLHDLAQFSETAAGAALIRGTIVTDLDPQAKAVLRNFWDQRLAVAGKIIVRGQDRGEVTAAADTQLVLLALGGLVHLYVTHIGDVIPDDLPARAVAMVMPSLRANG